MSILLLTDPVPGEYFAPAVRQQALPGMSVWTSIEDAEANKVEAILGWQLLTSVPSRFPNLKVVCSMGAGVDKLLGAADLSPDIPITRVSDPMQALAMAQYVLLMVLRHTRDLPKWEAQQQRKQWLREPPPFPYQHTVAVLGLGAIGGVIAGKLRDMGFAVVGWARSAKQIEGVESFVGADGLAPCLARADIIVNVLPATADTRGLLDFGTLSAARQGAYLVNVGRGDQLVEDDFARLIHSGQFSGGALDVVAAEPLPEESPMWRLPNVLITPHCAAEPTAYEVARQLIDALQRVRRGELPDNLVDRTRGY